MIANRCAASGERDVASRYTDQLDLFILNTEKCIPNASGMVQLALTHSVTLFWKTGLVHMQVWFVGAQASVPKALNRQFTCQIVSEKSSNVMVWVLYSARWQIRGLRT